MPSPTPPNSPPDSPEPDALMAKMMGFSTFGSKPNSKKKRKLHPTSPENTGSGSNSLPLGTGSRGKRKLEQAKDKGKDGERDQGKRNEGDGKSYDQRDTEDDDSVDDGGVPLKGLNQISQPQLNQSVKDSGLILDSIIKSHAKVLEEEEENSAKSGFEKNASSVLAEGLPLYMGTQAQENPSVFPYQSPSQLLLRSSSYPNPASHSQSQHGRQKHDFKSLRKGIRDERGDMAYYDGSFVEDPWRALLT